MEKLRVVCSAGEREILLAELAGLTVRDRLQGSVNSLVVLLNVDAVQQHPAVQPSGRPAPPSIIFDAAGIAFASSPNAAPAGSRYNLSVTSLDVRNCTVEESGRVLRGDQLLHFDQLQSAEPVLLCTAVIPSDAANPSDYQLRLPAGVCHINIPFVQLTDLVALMLPFSNHITNLISPSILSFPSNQHQSNQHQSNQHQSNQSNQYQSNQQQSNQSNQHQSNQQTSSLTLICDGQICLEPRVCSPPIVELALVLHAVHVGWRDGKLWLQPQRQDIASVLVRERTVLQLSSAAADRPALLIDPQPDVSLTDAALRVDLTAADVLELPAIVDRLQRDVERLTSAFAQPAAQPAASPPVAVQPAKLALAFAAIGLSLELPASSAVVDVQLDQLLVVVDSLPGRHQVVVKLKSIDCGVRSARRIVRMLPERDHSLHVLARLRTGVVEELAVSLPQLHIDYDGLLSVAPALLALASAPAQQPVEQPAEQRSVRDVSGPLSRIRLSLDSIRFDVALATRDVMSLRLQQLAVDSAERLRVSLASVSLSVAGVQQPLIELTDGRLQATASALLELGLGDYLQLGPPHPIEVQLSFAKLAGACCRDSLDAVKQLQYIFTSQTDADTPSVSSTSSSSLASSSSSSVSSSLASSSSSSVSSSVASSSSSSVSSSVASSSSSSVQSSVAVQSSAMASPLLQALNTHRTISQPAVAVLAPSERVPRGRWLQPDGPAVVARALDPTAAAFVPAASEQAVRPPKLRLALRLDRVDFQLFGGCDLQANDAGAPVGRGPDFVQAIVAGASVTFSMPQRSGRADESRYRSEVGVTVVDVQLLASIAQFEAEKWRKVISAIHQPPLPPLGAVEPPLGQWRCAVGHVNSTSDPHCLATGCGLPRTAAASSSSLSSSLSSSSLSAEPLLQLLVHLIDVPNSDKWDVRAAVRLRPVDIRLHDALLRFLDNGSGAEPPPAQPQSAAQAVLAPEAADEFAFFVQYLHISPLLLWITYRGDYRHTLSSDRMQSLLSVDRLPLSIPQIVFHGIDRFDRDRLVAQLLESVPLTQRDVLSLVINASQNIRIFKPVWSTASAIGYLNSRTFQTTRALRRGLRSVFSRRLN